MTHAIPLTQGQGAFVDDCDYKQIAKHKWCALARKKEGLYHAVRGIAQDDYRVHDKGCPTVISMHREIMNAPRDMVVHHCNGDGLDNRRGNLEIMTHQAHRRLHARIAATRRWIQARERRAAEQKERDGN